MQVYSMLMYQHSPLSRSVFEKQWRPYFTALFRCSGNERQACWLPNQVFRQVGEVTFYHPQPYYLRRDYFGLGKALQHLGEDEFVVVDRDAVDEESETVGLLFRRRERAKAPEDKGQFHIQGQPFELYAFGRRRDWGFVSSEPYNVGVLNAEGAAVEAFAKVHSGTGRQQIMEYLNHTPARFRDWFESNYLLH